MSKNFCWPQTDVWSALLSLISTGNDRVDEARISGGRSGFGGWWEHRDDQTRRSVGLQGCHSHWIHWLAKSIANPVQHIVFKQHQQTSVVLWFVIFLLWMWTSGLVLCLVWQFRYNRLKNCRCYTTFWCDRAHVTDLINNDNKKSVIWRIGMCQSILWYSLLETTLMAVVGINCSCLFTDV